MELMQVWLLDGWRDDGMCCVDKVADIGPIGLGDWFDLNSTPAVQVVLL